MQCEQVRNEFADYVIGQIQEPARSAVAEHLLVCESCRIEAEDLQTLWSALGTIPAKEPSAELQSRFHIMLEAYEQGSVILGIGQGAMVLGSTLAGGLNWVEDTIIPTDYNLGSDARCAQSGARANCD